MKKHIYFILFIACLFLLVSCNQQKAEWKGTIKEEDGVKRILNLAVNKKQFRIADHIQKNEYIANLPDFAQVYKAFNDLGKKYLLVGWFIPFVKIAVPEDS